MKTRDAKLICDSDSAIPDTRGDNEGGRGVIILPYRVSNRSLNVYSIDIETITSGNRPRCTAQ